MRLARCLLALIVSLSRASGLAENVTSDSQPRNLLFFSSSLQDDGTPVSMFSIASPESEVSAGPSPAPTATRQPDEQQPMNLLFIMADQLRYDAIQFIQEQMPIYKNKLKVRTPNIDRIGQEGVYFRNAYSQASSCGPARATLRSGCTMERTGVQDNDILGKHVYHNSTDSTLPPVRKQEYEQKIFSIRTYDQILATAGYQVESYGKWHMPSPWFMYPGGKGNAVVYDSYAVDFAYPESQQKMIANSQYQAQVQAWTKGAGMEKVFLPNEAKSPRSDWPYNPLPMDLRNSRLKPRAVQDLGEASSVGIDSLPDDFSTSAFVGTQALLAMERLASGDKPWSLTVSFENPHPPYIAAKEYVAYYLTQKDELLVPPNMNDPLENSDYAKEQAKYKADGYTNIEKVRGLTAVYYAMIEQVDAWVGKLLDKLEQDGLANNTMVVFTSDHGEALGFHGLQGKIGLLEEAIRVPLFMKLPGHISEGTVVDRPVSHLHVFSTILDYMGFAEWDHSDGESLRSSIDKTSFRQAYDDVYAVAEEDTRMPINNRDLTGQLASAPNFMIRHGPWKLFIAKLESSSTEDLMFNLQMDPYETRNLLGQTMNANLIGKAEHLKCLLLEWLRRHDNTENYYSDPKWNGFEGRGDIAEVSWRRTWRALDQWVSDTELEFDPPVLVNGSWRSNAWLYIGRTTPGRLKVYRVGVKGYGKKYFTVSKTSGVIEQNGHMRVRVSFKSSKQINPRSVDARVVIESNEESHRVVPVSFRSS